MVVDYTFPMVEAGRARRTEPRIVWAVGDAQRLPLPDGCADAYCIAFGLRNVTDIAAALGEARRVLKPGGRYVCLEFSRPINAAVGRLYDTYSFGVIPTVGAAVARDRAAYRYLVESIRRFPGPGRPGHHAGQGGLLARLGDQFQRRSVRPPPGLGALDHARRSRRSVAPPGPS